jgi:hypothetical protein
MCACSESFVCSRCKGTPFDPYYLGRMGMSDRESLFQFVDREPAAQIVTCPNRPDWAAPVAAISAQGFCFHCSKVEGEWVGCQGGKMGPTNYTCPSCQAVVAYEGDLPDDCLRCGSLLEATDRLRQAALRVVVNAYGTHPRHTQARDGGCRGDCIPCGLIALARCFPDNGIAVRVAKAMTR